LALHVSLYADTWARTSPDGHVFIQPWSAGPSSRHCDQVIYYQYQADRGPADAAWDRRAGRQGREGRRRARPGEANLFIALDGAVKSVNRELEAKARDLAGLKGYVTDLAACPDGTPVTADLVISSYHELWNIEELPHVQVGPVGPAGLPSQARLHRGSPQDRVFAALAVSRWTEARTGWSIRKFVKTARRHRTIRGIFEILGRVLWVLRKTGGHVGVVRDAQATAAAYSEEECGLRG
jgi:hypothetical protein